MATVHRGLMALSTVGMETGRKRQHSPVLLMAYATCGVRSRAETLLDKPCRIYLKEIHLAVKHGHLLRVFEPKWQ